VGIAKTLVLSLIILSLIFLVPSCGSPHNAPVAFIGDSLTLGDDASTPGKAYSSLVSQYIEQTKGLSRHDVFVSVDPATDLKAAMSAMTHDRKIVIIELGVHAAIDQSVSADQFRELYGSLLDCVTGDDTIVVAGTVPWLNFAAVTPEYERADLFSQIIIQEAAKRQVAVADIWSAMKLRLDLISTPNDATFGDGGRGDNFHPNDAGHAVIAQTYENALATEFANPPHRSFSRQCH
jgi:lysophospholipase L1-like esterase